MTASSHGPSKVSEAFEEAFYAAARSDGGPATIQDAGSLAERVDAGSVESLMRNTFPS